MKITVSGAGKHRTEELKAASKFFASIVLGTKLAKNIKLRIVVKSRFDSLGECEPMTKGRNPRSFRITLYKRNSNIVSTLAHEIVHVKQYARNELGTIWEYETPIGLCCEARWQGKNWKPNNLEDDYYDSPWEIEAYGREVGLYRRWQEYKKNIILGHFLVDFGYLFV